MPVVEDAAQSIGAEFDGRRAGSMGEIGCLSFYPTKNLGGAGDGGMLTVSRADLADKLQLLRGHGMRPRYYHQVVGINSRLDSFQAAVLNVKLPYLDRWTEMRQANARRYHELFCEAGLDRILGLPVCGPRRRHVWNQYVVRVRDRKRDPLRQFLADAKIGSEIYYPLGLHQQECFRHLGYAPKDLPETFRAPRKCWPCRSSPSYRPRSSSSSSSGSPPSTGARLPAMRSPARTSSSKHRCRPGRIRHTSPKRKRGMAAPTLARGSEEQPVLKSARASFVVHGKGIETLFPAGAASLGRTLLVFRRGLHPAIRRLDAMALAF